MMWLTALLCAALFAKGSLAQQVPFNTGYSMSYDDGLFSPVGDLSVLSEDAFTTLRHPEFPAHSVRIKKSKFCDGTVDSYTGYIDIQARHLFFYFFESRSDPDKDDVVFWTTGGPGGSSALGLFMELGPCRITANNGTKYFDESWNTHSNIFFVDQPIGVGYSYADYGETVSTTEDAAKDIASFVAIFFEHFTKFKGRPFHFSGESYGGRYLPLFASELYDQNTRLVEAGLSPVNLTSVMIGNGLTDAYTMRESYYEYACTASSRPPLLDIKTCIRMKQTLPRCKKWSKASCLDTFDAISCGAAMSFCDDNLIVPLFEAGFNQFDVTKSCESEDRPLCYPEFSYIRNYLNQSKIKTSLGVHPDLDYNPVASDLNQAFEGQLDEFSETYLHVAALLERSVKFLVYVGKNDFICNWLGNEKWTLALEWTGQDAFTSQELRAWKVNDTVAGWTRSANGLTFVTIEDAGHMVPYDKPQESLELVRRWLKGEEL